MNCRYTAARPDVGIVLTLLRSFLIFHKQEAPEHSPAASMILLDVSR
jgi:hypothetical protein